jgi:hypothetical protein
MTDNKKRQDIALNAIKAAFGTKADEYGGTSFVNHHLEEVETDYWQQHLGSENPAPEAVLNLLVFKGSWDDDCVFDFTLPDAVTDYVVSVRFDDDGDIEQITMES